jgi:hypothetical protein
LALPFIGEIPSWSNDVFASNLSGSLSLALFAAVVGLPDATLPTKGFALWGQASASVSGSAMNITLDSAQAVID